MGLTWKQKVNGEPCYICGFDRYAEAAHILPKRLGYGHKLNNTISLCPNHHKLYDWGLLNAEEVSKLEHYLLALTEEYRGDMKAQEYLYFQLGLHEPPQWLVRKRNKLKKRVSNAYF